MGNWWCNRDIADLEDLGIEVQSGVGGGIGVNATNARCRP